jgi:ABC-type multidrug transport system ATPase subunit
MSSASSSLSPPPSPNVFVRIESPEKRSIAVRTSDAPSCVLEWQHITLKVAAASAKGDPTAEKVILADVSGVARSGELLMLMGPSGAGKTSLLDCIAGRNGRAAGRVSVNGAPVDDKGRALMTYVVQDDLFYETLTVREHLVFQGLLRLGGVDSRDEVELRVDKTMREFGLMKVASSLVGGVRVRGISGGERKRLSLASEVLGDPVIFFVDEPTSGLDSFMAESVVLHLLRLARQGKTVLATIHQPSSALVARCDRLYLLADGAVVYDGLARDAVDYFSSLGYPCPAFMNPVDFFIRQLAVLDDENDQAGAQRVQSFIESWKAVEASDTVDEGEPGVVAQASAFGYEDSKRLDGFSQALVLAQRNAVRLLRDTVALRVSIMQSLMTAVIVGLVYLQLGMGQTGVQNFVGVFFFMVVSQTMITANGQFSSVPLELALVTREYQSGLYFVASWYAAKNVSELPMQILLPMVFFVPVYFMIGIGHGALVLVYQQLTVILVHIGIVFLLPMVLLAGLLINSDDIPVYLVWLEYMSPLKFGFEGLMKVFWGKIDAISCPTTTATCLARSGEQVLANYSMKRRSALGDGLLLLALSLGFRLVGFLALLWNLKRSTR